MEVQVAQQHADRSTLWCSLVVRMDHSVFQDTRLQPTPDQTNYARITDSMFYKPEHPIVVEAPKGSSHRLPITVIFQIR